uniref:Uncharacterized protein n=1 Tax=Anguilla anguilla TaxID=7936 RepID=A0A0E9XP60_ANGAN
MTGFDYSQCYELQFYWSSAERNCEPSICTLAKKSFSSNNLLRSVSLIDKYSSVLSA